MKDNLPGVVVAPVSRWVPPLKERVGWQKVRTAADELVQPHAAASRRHHGECNGVPPERFALWARIEAPRVPPTCDKAACCNAACYLSHRIVIALHV